MWCVMCFGLVFSQKIISLGHKVPSISTYDENVIDKMFSGIVETNHAYQKHKRCIRLSLEVAFVCHYDQKRNSGEPFVIHPYEVAKILCTYRMDASCIIAALLHDTVEDTNLQLSDITKLLTFEVAQLVEGCTKVSVLPHKMSNCIDPNDLECENMRSLIVAMSKDWRVLMLKMADRLHNMRTIQYMPIHKQVKIAHQTEHLFIPLAHRFGLWEMRNELGNLVLECLDEDKYNLITTYISEQFEVEKNMLEIVSSYTRDILTNYSFVLEFRCKSPYSIHKKMMKNKIDISKIWDIFALRIILFDTANSCYEVMRVLLNTFNCKPLVFKDYVENPKENGYQSLHFVVKLLNRYIEFQIRTNDMHKTAEYGTASHSLYKNVGYSYWNSNLDAISHRDIRERILKSIVIFFTDSSLVAFPTKTTVSKILDVFNIPSHTIVRVNNIEVGPNYIMQNADIFSVHEYSLLRKTLRIICEDRKGLLLALTNIVTQYSTNILSVNSITLNTTSEFHFIFEVISTEQVFDMIQKIKNSGEYTIIQK